MLGAWSVPMTVLSVSKGEKPGCRSELLRSMRYHIVVSITMSVDTPRLIKIGAAAAYLGVTPQTLRAWEASGELLPAGKSKAGTRYYLTSDLMGVKNLSEPTICYARVSTTKQKADLERQQAAIEAYCAAKGWNSLTLKDGGSGINYRKKGLQELLERILRHRIRRLVLTHKDRLLRFGAELVFTLCELQVVEIRKCWSWSLTTTS